MLKIVQLLMYVIVNKQLSHSFCYLIVSTDLINSQGRSQILQNLIPPEENRSRSDLFVLVLIT